MLQLGSLAKPQPDAAVVSQATLKKLLNQMFI